MKRFTHRLATALLTLGVTTTSAFAQWASGSGVVSLSPDTTAKVVIGSASTTAAQSPLTISGSDVANSALGRKIDFHPDANIAPYGAGLFGEAWTSLYANANYGTAGVALGFYDVNNSTTPFSPKLMVRPTGRVGIGTQNPQLLLHIYDASSAFAEIDRGANGNSGVVLRTAGDNSTQWIIGEHGTNNDLQIVSPSYTTPRLVIEQTTGNVGIGAAVTTAKLTVGGNIVANGSITGATVVNATYQDLAEWVPASADLDPGTVVVLDGSHDNQVRSSSDAYDTAVAGVVSANPGLLLGKEGASKEKIATTGRVKVHVDATAAPVAIGDLLVTSERSGFAMKSQPMTIGGRKLHQPGTIIGKALEPLNGGTGDILVLLSLQ